MLRREAAAIERNLEAEVADIAPGTFAKALLVSNTELGVQTLIQAHGLGRVRTNMALFGVNDLRGDADDRLAYGQMLRSSARFGTNVAILNVRRDAWDAFEATPPEQRSIALWWSNDHVGQLITLLAWLCERHEDWSQSKMTAYVPSDGTVDIERVEQLLDAARISASVVAVEATPASLSTALGGATLALAPLRIRRGSAMGPFETPLGMLVESLPLAVLVLATDEVDLGAEPDESALAEIARLSDQLAREERRTAALDSEAARLLVDAESARLVADSVPDDVVLKERAEEANAAAVAAFRRYVGARTSCRDLEDDVAALDPAGSATALDPAIWQSASSRDAAS